MRLDKPNPNPPNLVLVEQADPDKTGREMVPATPPVSQAVVQSAMDRLEVLEDTAGKLQRAVAVLDGRQNGMAITDFLYRMKVPLGALVGAGVGLGAHAMGVQADPGSYALYGGVLCWLFGSSR